MTTKIHSYLGGLGIDATNKLTLAANATVTVGNGTATGNVHVGGNMSIGNISPAAHDLAIAGSALIAGDLTLSAGGDGALQFPVASSIKVLDNSATSLVIEEADTAYMTIVTTDGSEAVKFDKALDINAAVQLDATLTIGANDQGYDVILYGDTASRNMTWDSSADSLIFSDNTKAVFGTGSDFTIFHDGTNALIDDTGDGFIGVRSDTGIKLLKRTGDENMLVATPDGAVDIYHNNAKKFETSSTGVGITGNIVVSGTVDGRDIAVNLPASLGDAGQVLKVNDAGNAGEWGDLEAGVGYQNSSTSVIPGTENTDLGNLTDASTDAFGIATSAKYDLMDPIGQVLGLDLGAL